MKQTIDTRWTVEKIQQIQNTLNTANPILVGIGAGFPAAAGVAELPLQTKVAEEQYWSFWMPYIQHQRLNKDVPALYLQLAELLRGKNYFVIDSNPDGFLQRSGLDLARIYKVQGDMARVQCRKNCCNQSWIGKQYFDRLRQEEGYLPKCPHCGAPLVMNVHVTSAFCQEAYAEKSKAYFHFINASAHHSLVVLELGVGYTMPELIRFPFEQIVMNHKHATLIRINTQHPLCVKENEAKAICAGVDLKIAIPALGKREER